MKGPKKDITKLSEQGVVTEEALIAYLHNKLSPEEKQELEKLLSEDPFARDALEGLQSSANQAAVTTSISSLNKKVRERSGLKERKGIQIHWVNYAWAAVLVGLLIGIGFIMVNFLNKTDDHNLALNEKKEKTETPVIQQKDTSVAYEKPAAAASDSLAPSKNALLTDTIASVASANTGAAKPTSTVKPSAPTEVKSTGVISQLQTNTATNTSKEKNAAPAVSNGAVNAKDKMETLRVTGKGDSATTYGYSAYQNNGVTVAELSKKELKSDRNDLGGLQDDAMKSFNSGDYNTAADDFDKILKHNPDNIDALYFGGISDYINGKTAKSEVNFDKLLKKGSNYIEGSKWYKANILLKKGKTDAAKTLLQDLTNTNGSYKERAIKKLAELGF